MATAGNGGTSLGSLIFMATIYFVGASPSLCFSMSFPLDIVGTFLPVASLPFTLEGILAFLGRWQGGGGVSFRFACLISLALVRFMRGRRTVDEMVLLGGERNDNVIIVVIITIIIIIISPKIILITVIITSGVTYGRLLHASSSPDLAGKNW